MKTYVEIRRGYDSSEGVLQKTIRLIVDAFGHQCVDKMDDADLVFTNSPDRALRALKDNETAVVALIVIPGERDTKTAAEALARSFRGRVEVCHAISFSAEEKDIATYLIEKGGERRG